MKSLATFIISVLFLTSITTATITKKHYHGTRNVKNKRMKRTNNDNTPIGENISVLPYHRSFVPDMSFSSQVEDMPTEEEIIQSSNVTDQPTKKNNIARSTEHFDIGVNTTATPSYSIDLNNSSDSTGNLDITDGAYNNRTTSNHSYITHFSCENIEQSKCSYEQVSLLCPSQCITLQGNYTNTENDKIQTTTQELPTFENTQYVAPQIQPTNTIHNEPTQANGDTTSPINLQYYGVPIYGNSQDYHQSPSTYIGDINNTYGVIDKLMGFYVNYDNDIEKITIDQTNNVTPTVVNSTLENEDDNTTKTPNTLPVSYISYIKPQTDQPQTKTLPSYMDSPEPTNSYKEHNNDIQDILSDSFYILAGVMDRTTKGFYLKNFGKAYNGSSDANETDHNNGNPDKDLDQCIQYNLNNCTNPYVSELCPNLCKHCTPWEATTDCSAKCGNGVQQMFRNCVFPNGTQAAEFFQFYCNTAPCNSTCKIIKDWGPCLKVIDGVSIRVKNCTLMDGSSHIYYEHRVCNEKNTSYTNYDPKFNATLKRNHNNEQIGRYHQSTLAAHISFDKFRDDINIIYDENGENNDISIQNVKLFDGNFTCGFGALFTNYDSIMVFNDNIFRNFVDKSFSFLTWVFLKSGRRSEHPQTIFQFISNENGFGVHTLELSNDSTLEWTLYDAKLKVVMFKKSSQKLKKDKWSHISIVYNENPFYAKIYINSHDSTLDVNNKMVPTATLELPNDSIQSFQSIGNNINLNKPFYGILDELYIFKRPTDATIITNIADTCRFRTGRGCPSPLLGFCPDCPSCDDNATGISSSNETNSYDNDKSLPYVTINPPTIS